MNLQVPFQKQSFANLHNLQIRDAKGFRADIFSMGLLKKL